MQASRQQPRTEAARVRTAPMWCPVAAQPAPPQYSRRAVRSVSTVELTVDAREAMRETATGERAAQADAPTVGSLRDSATAQATRTARATRGCRERVGRGPAGATAEPHSVAQATRCAREVPDGAP